MRRLQRLAAHVEGTPAAAAQPPSHRGLEELGFQPVEVGADSLVTPSNITELRDEGYTVVRGVVGEGWLQRLRERYDALIADEGKLAGLEFATDEFRRDVLTGKAAHPNAGYRQLLGKNAALAFPSLVRSRGPPS